MSGRERSRQLWFLVGALALLFLCCKPAYGQSSAAFTATLSGRVTDPAGLAVSGATVTVTSAELGLTRTSSTGDTGLYTFTFLPAGVYRISNTLHIPGTVRRIVGVISQITIWNAQRASYPVFSCDATSGGPVEIRSLTFDKTTVGSPSILNNGTVPLVIADGSLTVAATFVGKVGAQQAG